MKVRLLESSAREIVATGQIVEPNHQVEVPDDLGRDLVKQVDVWERVKDTPKSKDEGGTK